MAVGGNTTYFSWFTQFILSELLIHVLLFVQREELMAILTLGKTCPSDLVVENDNYKTFFIPHLKTELRNHTKMLAKPRKHMCL
jgi:hypothetical protein